ECGNRQGPEYQVVSDVIVRPAGRKGKGVFALRAFRTGEFIFRRRYGRVVSNADIRSLSRGERRHLCELDFETSAILLPPGCYLNHSCDPNAMRSGVKVFAWRSIRPGEEITIDYRLNAFSGQRSPVADRLVFLDRDAGGAPDARRFAREAMGDAAGWRVREQLRVGLADERAQRIDRSVRHDLAPDGRPGIVDDRHVHPTGFQ